MKLRLNPNYTLFFALAGVYVIWGSTYLGMRICMDHTPPLFTAAFRYTVAGAFFFVLARAFGIPFPTRAQFLASAWVGLLLTGFANAVFSHAIFLIPTGIVSVLAALTPLLTTLLDWQFFDGERPTVMSSIGLGLGLMGIVLLVNPTGSGAGLAFWPVFWVFLACTAWAWGSVHAPHLPQSHALMSTAVQLLVGGLCILGTSFALEDGQIESLRHVDRRFAWSMGYLIFIGSGLGYTSYVWLINNAPPRIAGTYAYVNPIVAIFLGWLVLHEKMSPNTLLISGLILAGVALMIAGKRSRRKKDNLPDESFH